MLRKPNNFEKTQVFKEFTRLPAGGHKCTIVNAEEYTSRTGKDMIKVTVDTSQEDKFPNYFSELYKNNNNENKKWSNNATSYILLEDNEGNCNRRFKQFTNAVEDSNDGFSSEALFGNVSINTILKGKKIGVLFREEEFIKNNGDVGVSVKAFSFGAYDSIEGFKIPKRLEVEAPAPDLSACNDEDLPF